MALRQLAKRLIPDALIEAYRRREAENALSEWARRQRATDAAGLRDDVQPEVAIELATHWLCRAQDRSTTADGGISRHFSLNSGWAPSYPETTGYIVPTFIALADRRNAPELADRARRMLDWLVAIQLPEGGFQGGMISHDPVPVTFNTGQILLGLAAGAAAFEAPSYREAARRAATWLQDTQDDDGCWRRFATPFAAQGEKTYETHVAWGLLEAERVLPGHGFGDSALRQIHWAAGNVQANGWIKDCCLSDPTRPLTHTLGYALRGFVEGYRFSHDENLLKVALQVAEGLRGCVREDGHLAGRLESNWAPAVPWVCLTGSVQIAASFLDLFWWTGDDRWRDAADRLIGYVRRTIITQGDGDNVGAIAGSFPIDGGYGPYEYLNWAAKFFIDAQVMTVDGAPFPRGSRPKE
jgi:hypothetical protein